MKKNSSAWFDRLSQYIRFLTVWKYAPNDWALPPLNQSKIHDNYPT